MLTKNEHITCFFSLSFLIGIINMMTELIRNNKYIIFAASLAGLYSEKL